mmetsp:Transcript_8103/g.24432  ORF Transcript_8103/g.24432 Transcript_8103/m.24432 type:complete len:217 (-) Transcript_8103:1221-1871(-)
MYPRSADHTRTELVPNGQQPSNVVQVVGRVHLILGRFEHCFARGSRQNQKGPAPAAVAPQYVSVQPVAHNTHLLLCNAARPADGVEQEGARLSNHQRFSLGRSDERTDHRPSASPLLRHAEVAARVRVGGKEHAVLVLEHAREAVLNLVIVETSVHSYNNSSDVGVHVDKRLVGVKVDDGRRVRGAAQRRYAHRAQLLHQASLADDICLPLELFTL